VKAIIFAAGLGKRMQPLTRDIPKALVVAGGKTLLERQILTLRGAGIRDIVVNVHYHGESIISFLEQNHSFGIHIAISDERDVLLDTGGGLLKAAWFFDDQKPFLAINVDVVSDIDLNALYDAHLKSGALATLAVRNRESGRYFLFDKNHMLCGWKNIASGEKRITRVGGCSESLAFSGIQIIEPRLFGLVSPSGKRSVTDMYLSLASGNNIFGYLHDRDFWMDIGTAGALQQFETQLANGLQL
jgi:NDP-sugar pyrophosphorylase family protein